MKNLFVFLFLFCLGYCATAQEITMFPGFLDFEYYQDDHHITKRKLLEILSEEEILYADWKRSRTYSALAISSGIAAFSLLIGGAASYDEYDNHKFQSSDGLLLGAIGLSFASGIFTSLDINLKKKTILRYNSTFDKSQSARSSLNLKGLVNGDGIGLALQF
jgi:hypothetical protein